MWNRKYRNPESPHQIRTSWGTHPGSAPESNIDAATEQEDLPHRVGALAGWGKAERRSDGAGAMVSYGDFDGDFVDIYRHFMLVHGYFYGDVIGIYRYFMVIQWDLLTISGN